MANEHSYPRRNAVTRRFTLGAPRDIRVGADGARVAFLRSSGPEDPVNALWVFDVEARVERLIVDPASLGADDADLPPEERARRERARESGGGIVAFDGDRDLTAACFALGGQIGRADLVAGTAELLDTMAGGFDPRLAPDGSAIAYVAGDGLRVVDADGDRSVIHEDGDTVSWGAAEFIAGEEMGRTRGFWWAPDSQRLLVERVDVAPINTWHIAAPVTPWETPHSIRYPGAGTANADVALAIIGLDGDRVHVDWNATGEWEYLVDASWSTEGLILTVQTRDQRTLAVLDVDPASGRCSERYRTTDEHWVELIPGTPRLHDGKLITVEDRGAARRLCIDGTAVTGDGWQVRSVVDVDDDRIVIRASSDPTTVDLVSVTWDGDVTALSPGGGIHNTVIGGDIEVRTLRRIEDDTEPPGVMVPIGEGGVAHVDINDFSERPSTPLDVTFHRCGDRELTTALVLPNGHDGVTPLPVLMDPYGGPHAQRVQRAAGLFHASQWFADQGFAVVVIDGRGTPGRGPAFEREVRGDLAAPVLDDQIDGLHALAAEHPFLDLSRVAIKGWSFGGYLAALAVLRRPDVFHAAIAGAPVTDWRLYDTHYTERYLGNPNDEPENYERTDLCADAAALGDRELPPLMLIHGLADDNVVAAHTLQLSRALLEAGKPHTVLPLSGVTHMTPQAEVAENLLLVQLAFLREALGIES
ncbi:MAG: prolyl oligopeptidase family serine peptidase [Actinomycetota bacterium]